MNRLRLLVITAIWFTGMVGFGQAVTIQAYLDSNTIWVGDQIRFTLEVTNDGQHEVLLPLFENTLGDEIEILEHFETDTTIQNGEQLLKKQLLVTAFDSGMYYIPELPVKVISGNDTNTLHSSSTYLEVKPYFIDELEEEVADIKEIEDVPITFREILPYLLIYIALALIIPGIYYWMKYRKKGTGTVPSKPKEPAYVIAERELNALKKEKLWQQDDVKEYYVRLTNILRKYIEHQFEIKAMEQTTNEILGAVNNYGLFDRDTRQILADMLPLADMVKFARGTADPDENIRHLENAYKFIQMTKEFIPDEEGHDEETKSNEA